MYWEFSLSLILYLTPVPKNPQVIAMVTGSSTQWLGFSKSEGWCFIPYHVPCLYSFPVLCIIFYVKMVLGWDLLLIPSKWWGVTLGSIDLLLRDGWVPVDEWAMLCFVKDGVWYCDDSCHNQVSPHRVVEYLWMVLTQAVQVSSNALIWLTLSKWFNSPFNQLTDLNSNPKCS